MTYVSRDVLELRRQLEALDKKYGEANMALRIAQDEVTELRKEIQDAQGYGRIHPSLDEA